MFSDLRERKKKNRSHLILYTTLLKTRQKDE